MNTRKSIEYWVIPPEADAEFVACMEEVLDTYERAYDPDHPVICRDEQPVQLIREVRKPIEASSSHPRRVDYEYERAGTASSISDKEKYFKKQEYSIFLFQGPLWVPHYLIHDFQQHLFPQSMAEGDGFVFKCLVNIY